MRVVEGKSVEYRKRKGKQYDTWHWREDCPQWPTDDYKTRKKKPKGGGQELCTICRRMDDAEVAAGITEDFSP